MLRFTCVCLNATNHLSWCQNDKHVYHLNMFESQCLNSKQNFCSAEHTVGNVDIYLAIKKKIFMSLVCVCNLLSLG